MYIRTSYILYIIWMYLRVPFVKLLRRSLKNRIENCHSNEIKRNYHRIVQKQKPTQSHPHQIYPIFRMSINKDKFYRQVESEIWILYKHFPSNIIDTFDNTSCAKFIYENLKNQSNMTSNIVSNTVSNIEYNLQDIEERVSIIRNYRNQLQNLMNIPQVKQRSPEWYEMRKERLTASATAQALGKGKFGTRNQLLQSKAFPDLDKWFPNTSGPMYHGTMLEEMTSRCYSQRNNDMKIYEFGMLKHPDLNCYGASPDGITELGIMIEIKTPYRREVNGNIPEEYYLQMQGQMAACGLHECDFVDCKIDVILNENDYINQNKNDSKVDHGIIIEDRDDYGTPKFLYSPEYLNVQECIQWKNELIKKERHNFKLIKVTYWKLYKIIATRVYFDEQLWNSIVPEIQKFWDDVIELRKNVPQTQIEKNIKIKEDNSKKQKYDFIDSDSE